VLGPIADDYVQNTYSLYYFYSQDASEDDVREEWDNKTQFFMGVLSYAVGFGGIFKHMD
jgi:hypothetical protein